MPTTRPPVACLCFSKDRPLQLQGYIDSLRRHGGDVALTILYACGSPQFEIAYERLAAENTGVEFVPETNFRRQVSRWVQSCDTDYVMFGCDDVVFKNVIEWSVITKTFAEDPGLLGFSLRLGEELYYCATQVKPMRRPKFIERGGHLLWNWRGCELDWGYAFELDSTIYPRALMEVFLQELDAAGYDWGQPNRFELYGSNLITQIQGLETMAAFGSARASVITVNRVQDVAQNFVYDDADEYSPAGLLDLWNDGVRMDLDAYDGRPYPAVHVGDLRLEGRLGSDFSFHLSMMRDLEKAIEAAGHPVGQHPGFGQFRKNFSRFFQQHGLHQLQRVMLVPCLDQTTSSTPTEHNPAVVEWVEDRTAGQSGPLILGEADDVLADLEARLAASSEIVICTELLASIGMGRFSEGVSPSMPIELARSIVRVLTKGGRLVGSVPVSWEAHIMFDAFRVYTCGELLEMFPGLRLEDEATFFSQPGIDHVEELGDFQHANWCFELRKI